MRSSGILLHISSLPSPYGIGTFGREAYRFVDFLQRARQTVWQILPLGATGYGDSPYQSFSTFAGNPYFIDLDLLCEEGLLTEEDYKPLFWGGDAERVDYALLYRTRYEALRMAYKRFDQNDAAYLSFVVRESLWLNDFALFMAVKAHHDDVSWHLWDTPFRTRDAEALTRFKSEHASEVGFWRFLQFKFFEQWERLKRYANEKGVRILGDLPIYVADDSADVWANPALFDLDEKLNLRTVAGVPPDAFTAEGQLWGNPVYDWNEARRQSYAWWIERMRMASRLYDIVRLDHFRGFESFYVLESGSVNAVHGVWRDGPGMELFDALESALGPMRIIAENLGFLTPAVRTMHAQTGFPGMNLLQFAFGADDVNNENLPHNIGPHSVAYAGTHDNAPVKAWFTEMNERDKAYLLDYMNLTGCDAGDFVWRFLRVVLSTPSELAVLTMQDCLEKGAEARMNAPSTLSGNWQWRAESGDFSEVLAEKLAHITKLYGRC